MEKCKLQIIGPPLIKFQDSEKIASLQKGHLYAKTLGYYRAREMETGDMEIGDKYEAMIHVNEGMFHICETGEEIQLNDDLLATSHSDDYVFCMFSIYQQLDNFEFSDTQKEKMLSFGDTALVILNGEEFIRRVYAAARAAGYETYFKRVTYYDSTVDNGSMIIDLLRGMWNVAFWKRKEYQYQQEARFVFISSGDVQDHLDLDIGDISDISAILPARQVLTTIVTKEN